MMEAIICIVLLALLMCAVVVSGEYQCIGAVDCREEPPGEYWIKYAYVDHDINIEYEWKKVPKKKYDCYKECGWQ